MRREYIEDAVLVIGGGAVIAGAWIVYWQAGLIVAGVVCMLLGMLAARHRAQHQQQSKSQEQQSKSQAITPEQAATPMSAAAWRFKVPGAPDDDRRIKTH